MKFTWGLSDKGMSGSLSSQAHSGNKQVLGLHGSGGTPSFGSHVLDWTEQNNIRQTSLMTNSLKK